MTTTTLNRTDLTQYETEKLHLAQLKVRDHAIAVGAFMTRYGREEVLMEAADLFMFLLDDLVADTDIRDGALEYGMFMAEFRKNDRQVAQTYQLQGHFLFDLYRAVLGTREGNKAKAAANA